MVLKLIYFKMMSFQYLKAELLFFLTGALVEVIASYYFLQFLLGDILKISGSNILLVLGIHRLLIGISRAFYLDRLLSLPNDYRNGLLDKYFVAPINSKIYYCFSGFSVREVFNILFGLALTFTALPEPSIRVYITTLLCILLISILLFSMLLTVTAFLASRVNPGPLNAIFTNIFSLAQFKSDFFPFPINSILGVLFPVGLLVWGPIELIINNSSITWILMISLTITMLIVQEFSWRCLSMKYNSAN